MSSNPSYPSDPLNGTNNRQQNPPQNPPPHHAICAPPFSTYSNTSTPQIHTTDFLQANYHIDPTQYLSNHNIHPNTDILNFFHAFNPDLPQLPPQFATPPPLISPPLVSPTAGITNALSHEDEFGFPAPPDAPPHPTPLPLSPQHQQLSEIAQICHLLQLELRESLLSRLTTFQMRVLVNDIIPLTQYPQFDLSKYPQSESDQLLDGTGNLDEVQHFLSVAFPNVFPPIVYAPSGLNINEHVDLTNINLPSCEYPPNLPQSAPVPITKVPKGRSIGKNNSHSTLPAPFFAATPSPPDASIPIITTPHYPLTRYNALHELLQQNRRRWRSPTTTRSEATVAAASYSEPLNINNYSHNPLHAPNPSLGHIYTPGSTLDLQQFIPTSPTLVALTTIVPPKEHQPTTQYPSDHIDPTAPFLPPGSTGPPRERASTDNALDLHPLLDFHQDPYNEAPLSSPIFKSALEDLLGMLESGSPEFQRLPLDQYLICLPYCCPDVIMTKDIDITTPHFPHPPLQPPRVLLENQAQIFTSFIAKREKDIALVKKRLELAHDYILDDACAEVHRLGFLDGAQDLQPPPDPTTTKKTASTSTSSSKKRKNSKNTPPEFVMRYDGTDIEPRRADFIPTFPRQHPNLAEVRKKAQSLHKITPILIQNHLHIHPSQYYFQFPPGCAGAYLYTYQPLTMEYLKDISIMRLEYQRSNTAAIKIITDLINTYKLTKTQSWNLGKGVALTSYLTDMIWQQPCSLQLYESQGRKRLRLACLACSHIGSSTNTSKQIDLIQFTTRFADILKKIGKAQCNPFWDSFPCNFNMYINFQYSLGRWQESMIKRPLHNHTMIYSHHLLGATTNFPSGNNLDTVDHVKYRLFPTDLPPRPLNYTIPASNQCPNPHRAATERFVSNFWPQLWAPRSLQPSSLLELPQLLTLLEYCQFILPDRKVCGKFSSQLLALELNRVVIETHIHIKRAVEQLAHEQFYAIEEDTVCYAELYNHYCLILLQVGPEATRRQLAIKAADEIKAETKKTHLHHHYHHHQQIQHEQHNHDQNIGDGEEEEQPAQAFTPSTRTCPQSGALSLSVLSADDSLALPQHPSSVLTQPPSLPQSHYQVPPILQHPTPIPLSSYVPPILQSTVTQSGININPNAAILMSTVSHATNSGPNLPSSITPITAPSNRRASQQMPGIPLPSQRVVPSLFDSYHAGSLLFQPPRVGHTLHSHNTQNTATQKLSIPLHPLNVAQIPRIGLQFTQQSHADSLLIRSAGSTYSSAPILGLTPITNTSSPIPSTLPFSSTNPNSSTLTTTTSLFPTTTTTTTTTTTPTTAGVTYPNQYQHPQNTNTQAFVQLPVATGSKVFSNSSVSFCDSFHEQLVLSPSSYTSNKRKLPTPSTSILFAQQAQQQQQTLPLTHLQNNSSFGTHGGILTHAHPVHAHPMIRPQTTVRLTPTSSTVPIASSKPVTTRLESNLGYPTHPQHYQPNNPIHYPPLATQFAPISSAEEVQENAHQAQESVPLQHKPQEDNGSSGDDLDLTVKRQRI